MGESCVIEANLKGFFDIIPKFEDACNVRNFGYAMSVVLTYLGSMVVVTFVNGQLVCIKFCMLGVMVLNFMVAFDSMSYRIMVQPIEAWCSIIVRCVIGWWI